MRDRTTASFRDRPTEPGKPLGAVGAGQDLPNLARHFAPAEVDLDGLAEAIRLLLGSDDAAPGRPNEAPPRAPESPCFPCRLEG